MSAHIIPFMRDQSVNGSGCSAHGTALAAPPPNGGEGQPIPADLSALIESHVADLYAGSVANAMFEVFGGARDARNARPYVPEGLIAAAVVELLAPVLLELGAVVDRLARRGALAEASELDRELSELDQAEALEMWRWLTPAQRSAVIWVQQQAMTPSRGDAA